MNRRRPNPWIAIPSLFLGALAGALGWTVTYISCGTTTGCFAWAAVMAVVAFLGVTIGTGLVLVLVYRSIAEWREAEARGQEPPGPGCEAGS